MLFLLHSAFMLSVVKLLLKWEARVCALNSHDGMTLLMMENHGKKINCVFEFLWEPCTGLLGYLAAQ